MDYSTLQSNPKIFLSAVCQHIGVDSQTLLSIVSDSDLRLRINSSTQSSTDTNNPNHNSGSSSSTNQLYYPQKSLLCKMHKHLQPMQDDFNKLLQELEYPWQLGTSTA